MHMKKISMRWAVASALMAIVATACTVTTETGGTGGSAGVGGWAGIGGSTLVGGWAGTGGAGGTGGTAGVGGSDASVTGGSAGTGGVTTDAAPDAAVCAPSAAAGPCETCAFTNCHDEICACKADVNCGGAVGDYLTCMSAANADPATCGSELVLSSGNSGATAANDLAACMTVDFPICETTCQPSGGDAGAD
jgi:hypothetical protein